MPQDREHNDGQAGRTGEARARPVESEPTRELMPASAGATRSLRAGEFCPECSGLLIPESGCFVCMSCGYSVCG
jgi:hypothetical protein